MGSRISLYITDEILKDKAKEILLREGVSLSEFFEKKLAEVVEQNLAGETKKEKEEKLFRLSYGLLLIMLSATILFIMSVSFLMKNFYWMMMSGIFAVMVIVFNALKEVTKR